MYACGPAETHPKWRAPIWIAPDWFRCCCRYDKAQPLGCTMRSDKTRSPTPSRPRIKEEVIHDCSDIYVYANPATHPPPTRQPGNSTTPKDRRRILLVSLRHTMSLPPAKVWITYDPVDPPQHKPKSATPPSPPPTRASHSNTAHSPPLPSHPP